MEQNGLFFLFLKKKTACQKERGNGATNTALHALTKGEARGRMSPLIPRVLQSSLPVVVLNAITPL